MKAKQLRNIVDFIRIHSPNHNNQSIRALLKTHPEQFIDLLNTVIEEANAIPASVANFINEISKQPKQERPTDNLKSLNKENVTMKIEKQSSIIARLAALLKGAWKKAIQLLTTKDSKVKLVISAAVLTVLAIITNKATVILTLIAAVKSKGLIQSVISTFSYVVNFLRTIKNTVTGKLTVLIAYIKIGGMIVISKLISLKNIIIAKLKQAWNWVAELFTVDVNNDNTYNQAA